MTRIKICGLTRQEDAELAAELGADLLGFIFEPTSPRFVGDPDWSPEWLNRVDVPKVAVFGVATHEAPSAFDFVQAHTWQFEPAHRFHVVRIGSEVEAPIPDCDLILLDAYDRHAHGGTGKTIDWGIAAEFVCNCRKPVLMAGGLTPDNVAAAVEKVRPWGVDVSSGVESSPGIKDPAKLRDFFAAIRS